MWKLSLISLSHRLWFPPMYPSSKTKMISVSAIRFWNLGVLIKLEPKRSVISRLVKL